MRENHDRVEPAANAARPIDILLVEDNRADAELTVRALKTHDLASHLAIVRDGAEALDFIFATGAYAGRRVRDTPKLMLLDLKLPKVDGIEVLRRVKGDERTRAIPVVVLTSSREERDVVETYALGVNSYVVKPVEFDRFAHAVSDVGLYWLRLNHPLR